MTIARQAWHHERGRAPALTARRKNSASTTGVVDVAAGRTGRRHGWQAERHEGWTRTHAERSTGRRRGPIEA
jgi:hypothetical protein